VGRLRKVLVCRPGLAHRRLTPTNADDLLFDDVLWVESAQRDHLDFVERLRARGVELARESVGARDYLMPPLPNTLYTRDTTCWLYGGLTMNPLFWPARHDETLLYKAIYTFHPGYAGSTVWWGDPELTWGRATFEGGDIMPIGNRTVLMGMSERTSRHAITQIAAALFAQGAAERVIVAGMPKLRAAMHLDTVLRSPTWTS
jgi:arginine deiminase